MARFVRNKDLIVRKIAELSKTEEMLIAKLRDGNEHAYLIEPFLDGIAIKDILAKLKGHEYCSLVVYNTRENFDVVVKEWDALSDVKRHFSIHFVNPFSKTEKKWAVYPATHNIITEKSHLKNSLQALFANVDATTKEEIEKIIKNSGQNDN